MSRVRVQADSGHKGDVVSVTTEVVIRGTFFSPKLASSPTDSIAAAAIEHKATASHASLRVWWVRVTVGETVVECISVVKSDNSVVRVATASQYVGSAG